MGIALKQPQFSNQDVEIIEQRTLWQGYFKMVKYFFRHSLYAGGKSDIIEREMFERGHAVAVIPYDPVTDEVVLIEQIRVGAFSHQVSPWLIEVVAGIIEQGEISDDVARRELFEESGLMAQSMDKVMTFLTSPGATSEQIDLYLARVSAHESNDIAGLAQEGEDIRVFRVPVTQAIAALDDGLIINGPTVIAIQWLARHHQKIRLQWLADKSVSHDVL